MHWVEGAWLCHGGGKRRAAVVQGVCVLEGEQVSIYAGVGWSCHGGGKCGAALMQGVCVWAGGAGEHLCRGRLFMPWRQQVQNCVHAGCVWGGKKQVSACAGGVRRGCLWFGGTKCAAVTLLQVQGCD